MGNCVGSSCWRVKHRISFLHCEAADTKKQLLLWSCHAYCQVNMPYAEIVVLDQSAHL